MKGLLLAACLLAAAHHVACVHTGEVTHWDQQRSPCSGLVQQQQWQGQEQHHHACAQMRTLRR
jgi:hypothetical protein